MRTHPHLHLSSYATGLLSAREPLGQIVGIAKTAETAIHGVLIASHHLGPGATGHARLDVITVKPMITLDIEPVGVASHRAVGVDRQAPADKCNNGHTMGRDDCSASAAIYWPISRSRSGGRRPARPAANPIPPQ
jgi:hypothetical protein